MADAIVSTADGRIKVVPFGSDALTPILGEVNQAKVDAEAAAGAAEGALAEIGPAKDAALLAISGAQATAVEAVEAEGDAKIALATEQADRSETAADAAEAARDDVTDARDTIVAAAGLTPTRAAAKPTLMLNSTAAAYVDLPDYSNQPATAANDWYVLIEGVASAMGGDGTVEYLLASASNARTVTLPLLGSASNKRLLVPGLSLGGTQFIRNGTYRTGATSLFLPPLEPFVAVVASIGGVPHFAAIRADGSHVAQKGDTNHAASGTWMFSGSITSLTINRASNELVITSGATPFGGTSYNAGNSVFIPGVGARVITTKVSSSQIKCQDPGPDATGIATSIGYPNTNYLSLLRLFERAGATTAGASNWTGGITRLLTRWGTTNLPGEFAAALVDGDGYIKQSWLASIIDGTYKTLPGANRATLDFGAATIATGLAYEGGSPAAQPTITGTTRKAMAVDQPSWLRLAPGQNPHNRVHAQEFGKPFGTVKYTFQSDAIPYGAVATIYDRDPREVGATVVMTTRPIFGPSAQADPTAIECMVHEVPANGEYWMRVSLATPSPESTGNPHYYVDVPCRVGIVLADWQQSLTGVAMGIFTGYASAAMSDGLAAVAGVWSGGSINAGTAPGAASAQTLIKAYAYSTNLRIAATAKWPDQMKHWGSVLLDYMADTYGRAGACMFVPLVRSGHSKVDAINDGITFEVAVGTATAGVALSFSGVNPFAVVNNKWTEPYTVELLVNNSLVAEDDGAARSGSTAPWTNGLTGSWNYDNWNASTVTLPYAATVKVRARCRQTSSAANNAVRENYGSEYVGDDYSYFGIDGVPRSGNMLDNIMQTAGITATLDSWIYSNLGSIGNSVSDADAQALLYTQFIGLKNRSLQYPQFTNPRTNVPAPWFLPPEQRITSLETNHQRGRWLTRKIAREHPDDFGILPGCLTCQIDSASGAHTDGPGSIQVFVQKSLAVRDAHAAEEGKPHDWHHVFIEVIGGIRMGANSIKLFITPNPFGIGQHVEASTQFAGLWYAATETHWASAYVDTGSYTYSIDASLTQPSITITSPGAMPSGYYDLNRNAVIPSTAGSKATQDTLLGRTLCVLNGGYPAATNRRGSDVHPSDTIAGIYIA